MPLRLINFTIPPVDLGKIKDPGAKRAIRELESAISDLIAELARAEENNYEDASIKQVALKTTTGEVTSITGSADQLILPGGEYGFYPQVKVDSGSTSDVHISIATSDTVYTTRINLNRQSGAGTVYARQRYLQSSPPYDLGDGDFPIFIYLLMDTTTNKILSTYVAPDPPWANNGPTNLGRRRKLRLPFPLRAGLLNPRRRDAILDALSNPVFYDAPISQEIKQTDMELIPHPYAGASLVGRFVGLLDPLSPIVESLAMIHMSGATEGSALTVAEMIHGNYFKFTLLTSPISRVMPPGVQAMGVEWKRA